MLTWLSKYFSFLELIKGTNQNNDQFWREKNKF